ncbi:MAG: rRNA pseudouridine synthase [Bacteriovoracaceae bacterium]|nr:rRNA pseudouridine synthase [Bacteriovoracaceae bacterium]
MKAVAIRLQKVIADAGITSRRKAEEMILEGRVAVNGEVVRELGTKVDPLEDVVLVDNEALDINRKESIYLVLNKPRGVMTTVNDPEGRQTVMDLVQDVTERIYPVGRLDYLSEGLLLMTNDGELANNIIHPRGNITKVYEVKVFGAVTQEILKKLRAGIQSEVGFLKPLNVRVIKQLRSKTWIEFRLGDGRNREIRRLCEACGLTVDKLKRVTIGGLTVEGIKPGSYRTLTKKQLLNLIGMDDSGQMVKTYDYQSPKKSINLRIKGAQPCTAADDQAFSKFRRETYFATIKELDERKVRLAEEEKQKMFAEKEEKHQKRQFKKKMRLKKKSDQRSAGVHAEIIKW